MTRRRSSAGDKMRRKKGRDDVQLPWRDKGWYADMQDASRDAALDEQLRRDAGPIPATLGSRNRPGMAISPAMNNPYFTGGLALLFGWVAWFLFDKLQSDIVAAVLVASFFGIGSLGIALFSAIRIRSWHRARRVAKAWVAEHGGEIPPELRWYT